MSINTYGVTTRSPVKGLINKFELSEGGSMLNRQGIQMKDDHLHFEGLVKERTAESAGVSSISIEKLLSVDELSCN